VFSEKDINQRKGFGKDEKFLRDSNNNLKKSKKNPV